MVPEQGRKFNEKKAGGGRGLRLGRRVDHQFFESVLVEGIGDGTGQVGKDEVLSAGGDGVVFFAGVAVVGAGGVDEEAERFASVVAVAAVTGLVAV